MQEKIENIIKLINETGETKFIEKANEESIKSFEEVNNVILPSQYKEWLLFSDGGELYLPGGVQLYGVEHKPLIDVNENDRPNDEYIVIGTLATGDPIVFKKGTQIIAIYNHEAGRIEKEETYEDFYSFLKDLHETFGIEESSQC